MAKDNVTIKPPRLSPNDTVMLIAPGHQINPTQLRNSIERTQALNLNVIVPKGILDSYGYFAGTVEKKSSRY